MTTSPPDGEQDRVTVGVDLGGTGTRVVALDLHGSVPDQRTFPTASASTAKSLAVEQLVQQIKAVAGVRRLDGVGIGASGPVDPTGIIRNDDTLPVFSHIDLVGMVSERLSVPCVIDNDAATAAIGENLYGAGNASSALLVVTLGTGVGVAMLTSDRPVRAADGSHPEAGHLAVPGPPAPCYCGLATCWEQLASRTALDTLTSNQTAELATQARAGDQHAIDLFHTYGSRVGAGLVNLLTIYRPERVVLGGGAARYLPLWEPGLARAVVRNDPFKSTPPFAQAQLGALSGAIGAAIIAR